MTHSHSTSATRKPEAREFTGRKMLLLMVGAFSVIIGVNLFMAFSAIRTFPGLEVPNSYVASQNFDREREAQEALGWTARAELAGGVLRVLIEDADGRVPQLETISARLGRPTARRDDFSPVLAFDGSAWSAPVSIDAGAWRLWLEAVSADGTPFRQRLILQVPS